MSGHFEQIACPECGSRQIATVQHTKPFWTYVRDCTNCHYTIMESEWAEWPEDEEPFKDPK